VAKKGGQRKQTFKDILEQEKAKRNTTLPPYKVSLTASAKQAYLELEEHHLRAEAAGDSSNQHCTTFRAVDDAIRRIIPNDPLNMRYALHEPLRDMYRIAKGRLRIVWAVAPEFREVLILYISNTPRKEGDAQDPYAILNAMAKAGYLKTIIEDWQRALAVPPNPTVN